MSQLLHLEHMGKQTTAQDLGSLKPHGKPLWSPGFRLGVAAAVVIWGVNQQDVFIFLFLLSSINLSNKKKS